MPCRNEYRLSKGTGPHFSHWDFAFLIYRCIASAKIFLVMRSIFLREDKKTELYKEKLGINHVVSGLPFL